METVERPLVASPVGANVRRLRGAESQEALAARLGEGWSQALISLIERGRWNPSYPRLRQIAEALGATVAELYAEPTAE